MTKRMLIDASHPDETRVVVLDGNKVEEFDFERADRKPLKGNIYLAKVTRVEPSLQAAFVEYGGNRHGFLPFSEIHPDYYRIPVADREALLAEEEAISQKILSDADETEGEETEALAEVQSEDLDTEDSEEKSVGENREGSAEDAAAEETDEDAAEDGSEGEESGAGDDDGDGDEQSDHSRSRGKGKDVVEELETESSVDTVGGDEIEEQLRRRAKLLRKYKIQEVIRRRQVMLIQVTKEERGTKGAALTTYLSLAGRYCVLMPNSGKGGGISRKISNVSDRRRLKKVLGELQIPQGMAVIVRTAGGQRSKAEIRRDYDYLIRLWDQIRTKTLESSAPSLIHEEGNLLNRAIRDQYTREMDEVLVEGEEGYKVAKNFMKMLMPSHAKKVKLYKDERMPLFQRFQVESNLDSMYSPHVHLKSGGSIVLNPTEALVAIDVNSGKATRERHIEETALKTNLEAAEEIGRQLRLRDLAGLIVIDFIDMEESRHNREVERKLKEALKHDRARIQLGRISPFGLLELSRQRLRPSLVEMSSVPCPHCGGAGVVRSNDSACMQILRSLTDIGINHTNSTTQVTLNNELAIYLLSEKRQQIAEIEERYGIKVLVEVDESLKAGEFSVDRVSDSDGPIQERAEVEEEEEEEDSESERGGDRKRGRRGGRKRRRSAKSDAKEDRKSETAEEDKDQEEEEEEEEVSDKRASSDDADEDDKPKKRRRRGRRGGRRRSRKQKDAAEAAEDSQDESEKAAEKIEDESKSEDPDDADTAEDSAEPAQEKKKAAPKKRSRSRKASPAKSKSKAADEGQKEESTETAAALADEAAEAAEHEEKAADEKPAEPKDGEPASAEDAPAQEKPLETVGAESPAEQQESEPPKQKKKGWWNLGG